jgi:pyridoxal phosphate enzyme (YggS family)
MDTLAERLAAVRAEIAAAAQRSGRSADDVTLVAVSKTHGPESLAEAIDAGHLIFGENRVQEAKAKIPLLPGRARWHFIGHLQKNKVRQALPLFELIHGVDSLELAGDLNRIADEAGVFPKVLLEINVAGEATKFGFTPPKLWAQLEELLAFDRLQIEGLMCIPPPGPRPEDSRKYFVTLRDLRDALQAEARVPLPQLSMGMSGDYGVAVEEGATIVRVGTAIFGVRRGKAWKPDAATGFDD